MNKDDDFKFLQINLEAINRRGDEAALGRLRYHLGVISNAAVRFQLGIKADIGLDIASIRSTRWLLRSHRRDMLSETPIKSTDSHGL